MKKTGYYFPLIFLFIYSIPHTIKGQNSDQRLSLGTGYVWRFSDETPSSEHFPAIQFHGSVYLNNSLDLHLQTGITPKGFENDPLINNLTDLDLLLRYKLYNGYLLPQNTGVGLFIATGVSANKMEWDGSNPEISLPVGLGLKFLPNQPLSFDILGLYKPSMTDFENYWSISASLSIQVGKLQPDQDNDGIKDTKDSCPLLAGPKVFNGCPDNDGDGIPDIRDNCPGIFGIPELNGCPDEGPDSDNDGVPDQRDDCPNLIGAKVLNGCPDTDHDGIIDPEDKCPEIIGSVDGCPDKDGDFVPDFEDQCPDEPGSAELKGCPDIDGDGIIDKEDKCPKEAGSIQLAGCPEIDQITQATLTEAQSTIQFKSGSANLLPHSTKTLDYIATILLEYSGYHLRIHGHTDAVGNAQSNQKLSELRAKTCADYLINRGIEADRLTFLGSGESYPIADNINENGRRKNRRVEFELFIQ